MQQTLLIQIFRRESIQNTTTANSAQAAVNGGASAGAVNGTSSGGGGEAEVESECPTCQAFSDSCCQVSSKENINVVKLYILCCNWKERSKMAQ